MVDATPRTPTPSSRTLRRSDQDNAPQSTATLTPPPTDKKARHSFTARNPEPSSPSKNTHAPMMAMTHSRTGSFGSAMPTAEQVQTMPVEHLRDLASDLIPSLGEARMELAHTKLQYQLLSIETREAAERAEVEHEMTRKEVEVLQAGSPIMQNRALISPDPRSTMAQVQSQLEAAMLRNQELEASNIALDTRLLDAKRMIRVLDGRNMELYESNERLKGRIRENREHLNAMRASGLIRSAPSSPKHNAAQHSSGSHHAHSINHYVTPARPRRPEVHHIPATPVSRIASTITPTSARPADDPFGALLFAGEVLDAQHKRASVPSTPSPTRTMRQPPKNVHGYSHTRGTHSLSSLPVTPRTSRLQHETRQAPATPHAHTHDHARAQGSRRNSVSTISDSSSQDDVADVHQTSNVRTAAQVDEELPASQASQAASDLLRRYPGTPSHGQSQERPSSGLGFIQTKLTGKIVKGNKRSFGERKASAGSPKKQKTVAGAKEDVGLGIGMWGTPRP